MGLWVVLVVLVLAGLAAWFASGRVKAGTEVRQSKVKAERLYQKGVAYRRGVDVEMDCPRARGLLQQAAHMGHVGDRKSVV